jgi:CMP-N-acetylneuraminic acid synthetase
MVYAVIPARGGSKGVPRKNIKHLAGYPLIAYSIVACRLSSKVERIVVSTDSKQIAEIAKSLGAEVPFLRPPNISQNRSTDREFIVHALDWFKDNEGHEPDYLVHIRPTTPLRDPDLIDNAVQMILEKRDASALRSVHEIPESPYKMFGIKDGFLEGLYPADQRTEYYNLPRQCFPPVYKPNGYVDIIKRKTVRESESLHGSKIVAFVTPVSVEVDSQEEFDFLEYEIGRRKYQIYNYLNDHYKPVQP